MADGDGLEPGCFIMHIRLGNSTHYSWQPQPSDYITGLFHDLIMYSKGSKIRFSGSRYHFEGLHRLLGMALEEIE